MGASRSFINHASCFKHRLRAHRATSESCARAAESQVSFISVARLGPTVDFAFAAARSRSRYIVLRGVALPSPSASSSDAIRFGSATFLQWDNRFILCTSTYCCLFYGKHNAWLSWLYDLRNEIQYFFFNREASRNFLLLFFFFFF